MNSPTVNTVTIYGGSSDVIHRNHLDAAFTLGKLIASEGWAQYNGGGSTGVMGAATRGAFSLNGIVHAVSLAVFTKRAPPTGYASYKLADTLHDRRRLLLEPADAVVCCAGGLGTLDEISEVLVLSHLQFVSKPVVFLNTNSYYDHLRSFLEHAIEERFIAPGMTRRFAFVDTPQQAIEALKSFTLGNIDKSSLYSSELTPTPNDNQNTTTNATAEK